MNNQQEKYNYKNKFLKLDKKMNLNQKQKIILQKIHQIMTQLKQI